MVQLDKAVSFAGQNHARYLAELEELLAIESISTLSEHKPDMVRAAEWLSRHMNGIGLNNVAVIPTQGHPVIYGEWLGAANKPTVLIYGHYDVQPVDPISEWTSPPFEPVVRGDNIFARGASDMKGNAIAVLKSLEAWMKTGQLPVNVKVLFEGEEEIGSPHLEPFINSHRDKLRCDVFLSADAITLSPNQPSLCCGLRGIAYFELWVQGPEKDLHSGEFGGAVHNPANVICDLIAAMHDPDGRITLPEFYEHVRTLPDDERAELARFPVSDEEFRRTAGIREMWGEKGFTTMERLGARPTLDVNGLLSGFTGEGLKTVIPAKAMAKVSMRLVPNQSPALVEEELREYVRAKAPSTVTWSLKKLGSASPMLLERNAPCMRAASSALEVAFGKKPVFKLEGGTLPITAMVKEKLGADIVMMGFSLPNDNFHSPNEKYHLPNFYHGIEAYIHFFDLLSRQS
jgi:acetylornithine deacetylase/succinyl-diaminopimelate desuccinylase-like protein